MHHHEIRSSEVTRIVQALAGLPGNAQVHVVAKSFPRLGPADSGTPYGEHSRTFRADSIPETGIAVPADAEQITIIAQGSLPRSDAGDELVQRLNDFFENQHVGSNWDVRARFARNREQESRPYELVVFSDQPPTNPAAPG